MAPKSKSRKKSSSASSSSLSGSESTGGYRYRDYREDDYYGGRGYDRYYDRSSPADYLSKRTGDYETSRYDDSGYNSYDNAPIERFGSHSGYGHHHKKECCPLVIKPLVFLALLGSLAAATAFLNVLITMNLGRKRRRRRRSESSSAELGTERVPWTSKIADVFHQGRC